MNASSSTDALISLGTAANSTADLFKDFSSVMSGALTVYSPQPVEISINIPKKPPVLKLREAKTREQLKAWGLRKR